MHIIYVCIIYYIYSSLLALLVYIVYIIYIHMIYIYICVLYIYISVYLLYWYKGTNTDACGAAECGEELRSTGVSICTFVPVKQVN
jgi:hypothetical protein